jgi:hypothetical protein
LGYLNVVVQLTRPSDLARRFLRLNCASSVKLGDCSGSHQDNLVFSEFDLFDNAGIPSPCDLLFISFSLALAGCRSLADFDLVAS